MISRFLTWAKLGLFCQKLEGWQKNLIFHHFLLNGIKCQDLGNYLLIVAILSYNLRCNNPGFKFKSLQDFYLVCVTVFYCFIYWFFAPLFFMTSSDNSELCCFQKFLITVWLLYNLLFFLASYSLIWISHSASCVFGVGGI